MASSARSTSWQRLAGIGAGLLGLFFGANSDAVAALDAALVARGAYLAHAGDCEACHTAKHGVPYAGGLALDTPFGTIVSPNITPDPAHGIGRWSDDDFYRALHDGIGKDGEFLYPAMPFPWYTKVTREDVLAIKAYLFSLPPSDKPAEKNHLMFPFSVRSSLVAWRQLFFKPGTFEDDPHASAAVNRGDYLVNGLAHCGECHNAHLLAGASPSAKALQGGAIDHWFAPNITSDVHDGIGAWTDAQLVQFLKTGAAPGKGVAVGPMMQTVQSLAHLDDGDLAAIAAYLKSTPPVANAPRGHAAEPASADRGADVYLSHCASCHGLQGQGLAGVVPALRGNGVVGAEGPQDVIGVVLGGLPSREDMAPMLAVGAGLSDPQVADVANYVRRSWGEGAPPTASPDMVHQIRPKVDTLMTADPLSSCPPVTPPALARLANDRSRGIGAQLAATTDANLTQRVPDIVAQVRRKVPGLSTSQMVNGLSAAYCPVVRGDRRLDATWKALQLGHFGEMVYSQVSSGALPARTP